MLLAQIFEYCHSSSVPFLEICVQYTSQDSCVHKEAVGQAQIFNKTNPMQLD